MPSIWWIRSPGARKSAAGPNGFSAPIIGGYDKSVLRSKHQNKDEKKKTEIRNELNEEKWVRACITPITTLLKRILDEFLIKNYGFCFTAQLVTKNKNDLVSDVVWSSSHKKK